MRNIIYIIFLFLAGCLYSPLMAQVHIEQDTTKQEVEKSQSLLKHREEERNKNRVIDVSDIYEEDKLAGSDVHLKDTIVHVKIVKEFKPNPTRAILYSAVFPGLGQVYNRKYWKLPIIYGGFAGVIYAVSWNGRMYNDYSKAYEHLMNGTGDSWKNFLSNPNIDDAAKEKLKPQFKRQKDTFRHNRDLAIILGVGLYTLCMIDAYVDAQLYDFDVSPDLSMTVSPVMFEPTLHTSRSFGVQCSIRF